MNNTDGGDAAHWVNRAWRLDDERDDPSNEHPRWLAVLAALSAWPGPDLVVQRRLLVPGASGLVSRALVVTIAGADVIADRAQLARDAEQLVAPLLAGRRRTRLITQSDLAGSDGRGWRETATIAPSFAHAELAPGARDALAGCLAALVEQSSPAALCWSFASPPPSRKGATGMVEARLSVSVDGQLPPAALAYAAVLAGLPASGWVRPRRLIRTPDPAWASSFSNPDLASSRLPATLAAELATTPVASAALRAPAASSGDGALHVLRAATRAR